MVKCINLTLTFRKKKVVMTRGLLTATQSLLCFFSHICRATSLPLCSRFRNLYVLDPFPSKALAILVMFFKIIWIFGFTRPSSRNTPALLYVILYFSHHFTFPLTLKTFLLCVTVAVFSRYPSPLSCRCRKVGGNCRNKMNCRFPDLEFTQIFERIEGLPSQRMRNWSNSQNSLLLRKSIGTDDWQCYLIFVVPSIMLYSSEISPTRCNNFVFILRNGFTLHVSGDNLTHHQELSPETCRVKPLRRIKTQLLHLVGLISLLCGNVMSGVDARTFVVLSKVGSHVPYMELFVSTEYITLLPRCRTSQGLYNRAKLYSTSS